MAFLCLAISLWARLARGFKPAQSINGRLLLWSGEDDENACGKDRDFSQLPVADLRKDFEAPSAVVEVKESKPVVCQKVAGSEPITSLRMENLPYPCNVHFFPSYVSCRTGFGAGQIFLARGVLGAGRCAYDGYDLYKVGSGFGKDRDTHEGAGVARRRPMRGGGRGGRGSEHDGFDETPPGSTKDIKYVSITDCDRAIDPLSQRSS